MYQPIFGPKRTGISTTGVSLVRLSQVGPGQGGLKLLYPYRLSYLSIWRLLFCLWSSRLSMLVFSSVVAVDVSPKRVRRFDSRWPPCRWPYWDLDGIFDNNKNHRNTFLISETDFWASFETQSQVRSSKSDSCYKLGATRPVLDRFPDRATNQQFSWLQN